jgi:hypothetical protein
MNVRACPLVIIVFAAALASCRGGRPFALHDTEGWEYTARCPDRGCARVLESPHPSHPAANCGPGDSAGFVLAGAGVIAACHACVRGESARVIDDADCRPLACETDPDCPPLVNGAHVRCMHGVCQVPGAALDVTGAVALCMAGAGAAGRENAGERSARVGIARRGCDGAGSCVASAACRAR